MTRFRLRNARVRVAVLASVVVMFARASVSQGGLAWAAAAESIGPQIDKSSCGTAAAKKIEDAWPDARQRIAAAKDSVNKAVSAEDPAQRDKVVGYAKMLGVGAGDLPNLARVLGLMDDVVKEALYVCGTKSDKTCRNRGGYVRRGEEKNGHRVVHLCPSLFTAKGAEDRKKSREQRVRTITHEAAHLVDSRISQPEGEGYCLAFDCDGACPGKAPLLVADNWAHFTHCASGQKADAGFVVSGDSDPPKPKKRK